MPCIRLGVILSGVLLLILFSLPPHLGALMAALSTEDLTKDSDVVVVGRVKMLESHWTADGSSIVTTATVDVEDVVRGKHGGQTVTIQYPGGEVGDVGYRVSDAVSLAEGEDILVFLKQVEGESYSTYGGDGQTVYSVVGHAQGKYTIDNQGVASKKGFAVLGDRKIIDNNMDISDLLRKIRGVK